MASNIAKLTVVKKFTYRGDNTEEFSNSYVMKGPSPTSTAQWDSIRDHIVSQEVKIFTAGTYIARVIGHSSTDPGAIAAYEYDYTVPGPPPQGSFVVTGGQPGAGDQAAVVEWLTNLKSVRGKPIYLRRFFHDPVVIPATPDSLQPAYITALTAFGQDFITNPIFGGLTNPKATATILSVKVLPFVTTRTLKRRGKRKKAA